MLDLLQSCITIAKTACELLEPSVASSVRINLTSSKQDIVPLSVIQDTCSEVDNTLPEPGSYIMGIAKCDMTVRVNNGINASLLECALRLIAGAVCYTIIEMAKAHGMISFRNIASLKMVHQNSTKIYPSSTLYSIIMVNAIHFWLSAYKSPVYAGLFNSVLFTIGYLHEFVIHIFMKSWQKYGDAAIFRSINQSFSVRRSL